MSKTFKRVALALSSAACLSLGLIASAPTMPWTTFKVYEKTTVAQSAPARNLAPLIETHPLQTSPSHAQSAGTWAFCPFDPIGYSTDQDEQPKITPGLQRLAGDIERLVGAPKVSSGDISDNATSHFTFAPSGFTTLKGGSKKSPARDAASPDVPNNSQAPLGSQKKHNEAEVEDPVQPPVEHSITESEDTTPPFNAALVPDTSTGDTEEPPRASVPEPATWTLFASGLALILLGRRRVLPVRQ